jgi:hypothetical protein
MPDATLSIRLAQLGSILPGFEDNINDYSIIKYPIVNL